MLALQRQAPRIRMRACGDCMWADRILKACEDLCLLNGERTPSPGTTPRERQTRIRALPISVPLISILSDDAKKAVFFVCDSSREKHSVGERQKIPQAVKLER